MTHTACRERPPEGRQSCRPSTLTVATLNVLDDLHLWEHRAPLVLEGFRRHCPDVIALQEVSLQPDTAQWLAVVESAHRAGIPTTATIMFGHVERPVHAARHLLAIRDLQERTGGFTEFVPLPFVPMNTPMFKRHASRNGPTWRETVLMHAVARLVLHPLITNIQASWVKLGPDGLGEMLEAGVNDLGGDLMNESISRAAGADWGQEMTVPRLEDLARRHGRPIAQRTTLYQPIDRAASPPPSPQAPHHLTTTELLEQRL